MSKKLYIGNLSYSTTDEELKNIFSEAGSVDSANVIRDKFSGRSRGFGFVEMSTSNDAKKAIDMFNEKEFGGRKLIVSEAKPMAPRENRE